MSVHFEKKRLHLKQTWTIARGSSDYRDNVLLTLERDGITGYGEAAPIPRYGETVDTALTFIEKTVPLLESSDWRHLVDVNRAVSDLDAGNQSAKAAIDIALMDWFCKAHQMPLYRYLGLDREKSATTFYSIGIDIPEKIREKVRRARNFPILKIKAGLDSDEASLAAVRDVTQKPLCVDANEGWRDKLQALEKLRWLETLNVEFVEQPMPADMLAETAWLRERTSVPIFADESVLKSADIPRLAEAFDGVNIKLMKSGGILEAVRMVWMARSLGMKVMLGCMIESSVAISAAAQLSPLVDYADLDGNLLIANDDFRRVTIERGRLILPDAFGIGAIPFGEVKNL